MVITVSPLSGAANAVDPDIADALRHAPPPGDFTSALLFPRFEPFPAKKPEDEDDSNKTEKFQLQSKLLHLRIPKLFFKDTSSRRIFRWIAEQSVALDPQHQGVAFVFEVDDKVLDQPVSVSHQDVPLDEAIRYVTESLDLRFDAERGSVMIRPRK